MVRPPRKQDEIVRLLRARILRGVYTERLPSGRQLAKELGTSPATIEMALGKLRALGVVRRETRRGTFVVPFEETSQVNPASARMVCPVPPHLDNTAFWTAYVVFGFERACREHKLPMVLSYAGTADEAVKLADLSLARQLPTVYMPSKAVRQWRQLIRYRETLVGRRTAIKNRIRSVLDREGLSMPVGRSAWTRAGIEQLTSLTGPVDGVDAEHLWRGELALDLAALATWKGLSIRSRPPLTLWAGVISGCNSCRASRGLAPVWPRRWLP